MFLSSRSVLIAILLLSACSLGCTPRVRVNKNPGPHDTGFRYYRPKPYLFISPGGASVETTDKENKKSVARTPSDEFVTMELQYLPDFSEEYSINVRPGLGVAEVSFKLDDGWNLTEVNQKLDSQTDENIAATAELLKAAGSLVPTGGSAVGNSSATPATQKWVIRATNVPLGYYESVISQDQCGKHLAGWRYVGFAPFNSCPTQICGSQFANCADDPNGPIYGLGFVKGVMTFQQLNVMRTTDPVPHRIPVPYGTMSDSTPSAANVTGEQIAKIARQSFKEQSNITPLSTVATPASSGEAKFHITITIKNEDVEDFNEQNPQMIIQGVIEDIRSDNGTVVTVSIDVQGTGNHNNNLAPLPAPMQTALPMSYNY